MLSKCFVLLSSIVALMLPSYLSAQEKGDKTAQAKMLSEQFAPSLLNNDLKGVMKVVAVPFFFPVREVGKPAKVIEKLDDLKTEFNLVFSKEETAKGTVKILKNLTYDEFLGEILKKTKEIDPNIKKPLDKVMKKDDRVVGVEATQKDGGLIRVLIMVAWRDGQPKIVGFKPGD